MTLMTLHTMRVGVLEASSAACGAPYLTTATYTQVNSMHPLYWDTAMTAAWIFFQGNFMGVDVRTNPHMGKLFWDNDIDGKTFLHATASDLVSMGVSRGSASRFVEKREAWLSYYKWPPTDQMDLNDPTLQSVVTGEPFNISITFVLERITTLDELSFEFEAELMVVVTWEDDKIFHRCEHSGVGGFAENDPCGLFWQPELLWPNVKLDPHPSATLSPAIIEDFGFTTVVGKLAAAQGNAGSQPSAVANHSIGMRMYRVRGTFMANFDFHSFPYDVQQLNVTVQMPWTLPLRKAKVVTRADPKPTKECDAGTPIWSVMCATASAGIHDMNSVAGSFMAAPDDPMARWFRAAMTLPPADFLREIQPSAASKGETYTPDYEMWSTATLSIYVRRIPRFYEFNFALIVAVLVILSFFSFLISPEALDGRLGLTLTVILGLNVFQIVVIDNTPATVRSLSDRQRPHHTRAHPFSAGALLHERMHVHHCRVAGLPDQHACVLYLIDLARRRRRLRKRRGLLGGQARGGTRRSRRGVPPRGRHRGEPTEDHQGAGGRAWHARQKEREAGSRGGSRAAGAKAGQVVTADQCRCAV